MKGVHLLSIIVFSLVAVSHAQTESDKETLRRLPRAYCDAWAKHDGNELAKIMAEDVDYVTVGAGWFRGRKDFETYHTRLLSGRFKDSTMTPLETQVRFLRPDLAIVHWSWTIEGDRNDDGSARPKRFGLMTILAEKRKGAWLIVAAQNTNAMSPAPEASDIKSPIALPNGNAAGSDEDALIQTEHDWGNALLKGDVAAFGRCLADEYILTYSDSTLVTKPMALNDLKEGALKIESFQLDDVKVRVYGDVAVVIGLITEKSKFKDEDTSGQRRFTDVFVRRDGRWQAVASHESPVSAKK